MWANKNWGVRLRMEDNGRKANSAQLIEIGQSGSSEKGDTMMDGSGSGPSYAGPGDRQRANSKSGAAAEGTGRTAGARTAEGAAPTPAEEGREAAAARRDSTSRRRATASAQGQ